jgi:hypothetical protein
MLTNNVKEIDFTFCTKSFISLINENPESYGCNVFVDIVSGSKRKNLPDLLIKSKYYGIHSDITKDYLKMCMLYLLECNLVSKKEGKYSVLTLTSNGKKWLLHDNPTLIVKIVLPQELCCDLEKSEILENKKLSVVKTSKIPTHIQSYELFQTEKKTINEIANIRGFTNSTIENHLADCLKSGLHLDFDRLGYTKEKHELILEVITNLNSNISKLKTIKDQCEKLKIDNKTSLDITYFDIKCVIALMK